MSAGTSAQDMAGRLFVSLGTIRTHIRAILMKLGVSSSWPRSPKSMTSFRRLAAWRSRPTRC